MYGDNTQAAAPRRILIVEDELMVAADIQAHLLALGYEVAGICPTAAAALDACNRELPDLVLMDIVLPGGMDGVEAADILVKRYAIPVVYLTAYADDALLKRARITEPCGYLLKPVHARELQAVISMALYKSGVERRLRQAAQVSEALMRLHDAVIVTDAAGLITLCNEAAERMTGVARDQVIGQPVFQIVVFRASNFGPTFGELFRKARDNCEETERYEGQITHRNGGCASVDLIMTPLRKTDGAACGWVMVLRDTGAYQRGLDELRAREQGYQALLSELGDGLVISDTQGCILHANEAACALSGYSAEELASRPLIDLVMPTSQAALQQQLAQRRAGLSGHYQIDVRKKDGSPLRVNIMAKPVLDAGGNYWGGYAVLSVVGAQSTATPLRLFEEGRQRDLMVREVHHRIKNHLQGVVGLLRQHATQRPELESPLEDAIARLRAVATVHGLQSDSFDTQVELKTLVSAISDAMVVYGGDTPRLQVDCSLAPPVMLAPGEAVPVALILNELLVNALKHGGRVSPEARVSLRMLPIRDGQACLEIANRFAEHAVVPDIRDLATLGTGLKLVASLMPRQGASLEYRREGEKLVTQMCLSLPVLQSTASAN